jgi:putative transcriptional regulator
MKTAFEELMTGLDEVKAFLAGERKGFKAHVPDKVDVKSIRNRLNMTQARFSSTFGFSLDAIKHWEGGRRTPEAPARTLLTVIDKNPAAVITALHPEALQKATATDAARARVRARRRIRQYVKPGVSLADELIAERRAAAKRQ